MVEWEQYMSCGDILNLKLARLFEIVRYSMDRSIAASTNNTFPLELWILSDYPAIIH
jgi:hypothetical protein